MNLSINLFLCVFYFLSVTFNFFSQNNNPKLVFPEKSFIDFNCTSFLNENTIIAPFHNSARVYKEINNSLQLISTIKLDADPIAFTDDENKIYIIDWNNMFYVFDKNDFSLQFKDSLKIIPKEIKKIQDKIIIASDSAFVEFNEKLESAFYIFNEGLNGVISSNNENKIITSIGVYSKTNDNLFNLIKIIPIEKLINNSFFESNIYLINQLSKGSLYCPLNDSIYNLQLKVKAIKKAIIQPRNIFLLDSLDCLLNYSLADGKLKIMNCLVNDFYVTESKLFLTTNDSIYIYNLDSDSIEVKIKPPRTFDLRKIKVAGDNIILTYSDLSFIFYSNVSKNWYRINESSGFKGNIKFIQNQLICSGDSHVFKYDLFSNSSSLIPNLYTFTSLENGNILYYGSESKQQLDLRVKKIVNKYDYDNVTSIEKIELFDSSIVFLLYNGLLIIADDVNERVIYNSHFFERISESELIYESEFKLYYLNISNNIQILLDEKIEIPTISFSLEDSSIIVINNYGKGKKYIRNENLEIIEFQFEEYLSFSSCFKNNENDVFLTSWNGGTYKFIDSELVVELFYQNEYPIFSGCYNSSYDIIGLADLQGRINFFSAKSGLNIFTMYNLSNRQKVILDSDGRFDGTFSSLEQINLICENDQIDLSQVKDSLWVPGLVEKIMNKEEIRIHDRPAPKLRDLNICELTPVIEPLDDGGQGLFRYRIIPRNGGLGETEVYINGNLTYKFQPEQLEKKREQNKDIYYLSISSDTLQGFLTGDKGNENPILVKAKVKGSGIYGRGVVLDIEKETDKENPKFFGLFIGVNDYGNPNKEQSELRYRNLDFAAKDANDLSKAVEATARNLFQQDCYIYNLTGTGNAENIPTKANMQKALKEIGEKAKASDILYIFFAGHGDIPEKSGEKEIRFMLHNADKKNLLSSSFGVDELSEWCDPKQIKAQKRVFVFDACHSGQIINQTLAFNGRGDEEATRIRQLDKLKDKNGMMILAAAADNESAYEDETLNQGVLTYHLLDAMKKEKDTSLIIRQWFDEAIEGVKEYSRANGNKQEPNSFGDGRFEIGNVNEQVRAGIDITCPKTRVGLCEFLAIGEVAERYPSLKNDLSNVFKEVIPRGEFVLSKNLEKAYRVSGVVSMNKGKVSVQYEVKKGEQSIASIQLPIFKKNSTAQEILDEVTLSIEKEIETLDNRKEQCVKNN